MTRHLTWLLVLLLAALIAGQTLFTEAYPPKFLYQALYGYKGLIGLGGCLLFIFVGKWVGKHLLQRPEEDDHA